VRRGRRGGLLHAVFGKGWRANSCAVGRQMRKADGGLAALATFVEQAGGSEFLIGGKLTLADIAIGAVLGWLSLRWPVSGFNLLIEGLVKVELVSLILNLACRTISGRRSIRG